MTASAYDQFDWQFDWIQTYTGKAFYPTRPDPDQIDIRDIAHALARQCRYGGHVRGYYSVAEHCCVVSRHVPKVYAMEALMHDAAEAYLVDVPRPIKQHLVGYREIEEGLERVIADKFGLVYPWPADVMEIDTRILNDERAALIATPPMEWKPCGEPVGAIINGWSPEYAEAMFLDYFREWQAFLS